MDEILILKDKINDPLDWWRINESRFPNLAKLARKYLFVPASSASSERLFSCSRRIATEFRASLKPSTIVDLSFFLFE